MFNYTTKNDYGMSLNVPKIVAHALVVLIALTLIGGSVGTVKSGERGVKTRFGQVLGIVNPGLYFKMPFIEKVVQMDVQTQKEQIDATAASNDLQSITTTVAVNFHTEAWETPTIYQNIGADYQSRVIDPAIQESVKAITSKYTASQLITDRETAREDMLALLTTKLQAYGISVDGLNIVNFAFSDQFNQAIESKVTAQQNAEAAQNKLVQVQAEADQTVAKAKADAEAISIQAQAINSQGGADYVELQKVQKWDGQGCTSYCGLTTSNGLLVTGK